MYRRKIPTVEVKQAFLSAAITDISAYIQLIDTKVSIIMGAVAAFLAALLSSAESIHSTFSTMQYSKYERCFIYLILVMGFASVVFLFITGIMTIRAHFSKVNYSSKWFLTESKNEYSYKQHINDVIMMTDQNIIENMTVELYKLNDIYKQKAATMKWSIRSFTVLLLLGCILFIHLIFKKIGA